MLGQLIKKWSNVEQGLNKKVVVSYTVYFDVEDALDVLDILD